MIEIVRPVFAQGFGLEGQYGLSGGDFNTLGGALGLLIGPAFMLAGVAVTIYFLIGAFRFLMSGGDKDAVSGARNMITHAIIGFILLMMMFLLLQFIPQFLDLRGFSVVK